MKIRCIVIDDEFPARLLLQDYISRFPHLELLGSYKSALEALPVIQQGSVDLMFLDIQMPDITGIDFLKSLNKKPLVVFTTAYMEYALEGYTLDVLDYLVKPFSIERFMQAINKAGERMASHAPIPPVINVTAPAQEEEKDFILVKADHKIYRLKFTDIIYIEGLREYVTYYCSDEKIVSLESLRNLEKVLPQNAFIRVHKSYIVNKHKVKAMYGNQLKMLGESGNIPIGKSYKDMVQKTLFKE
ncbi:DNA-binding response regulator [Marinilabiliaceae bacterium JC017]|nr:DNA-binding response regulator [Marinilabiliaceae bacterium JC017]